MVGNQGSDVGLDATSSETNDNDGSNISTQSGTALNGDGQRGGPKDDQTDPVDHSENQDRVVLSEVLISNNGTENRRDVAEELEENVQAGSASMSKTETCRSITSVGVVVDVVLEKTLATFLSLAQEAPALDFSVKHQP